MGLFSGFKLFDDAKSYLNTENLKDKLGLGDISSYGNISADKFFGLGNSLKAGLFRRLDLAEYGYIVDTVTRERLAFQYNVNGKESGGANYTEFATLARSVPQYHYKGGTARTLTLPITFTMRQESRQDVQQAMKFLQALAYPDYNGESEASRSPHPVVVIQGQLYTTDIWIVKQFEIEWGQARDPITQLPSEATANLTLVEISTSTSAKGYDDVLRI